MRTVMPLGVLGHQQGDRQRVVHGLGDVDPVVAECLHPLGVGNHVGEAEPGVHAGVDLHAGRLGPSRSGSGRGR